MLRNDNVGGKDGNSNVGLEILKELTINMSVMASESRRLREELKKLGEIESFRISFSLKLDAILEKIAEVVRQTGDFSVKNLPAVLEEIEREDEEGESKESESESETVS